MMMMFTCLEQFASAYSAGHSDARQSGVCNDSVQAHPCTVFPISLSKPQACKMWILLPAVGTDSQHTRIVVHSLAYSSLDVVWNVCAAYSALVHASNQRCTSLTLFLNMPTMQILPCDDACAQAYFIIDALHGITYTLQRITTSMRTHC